MFDWKGIDFIGPISISHYIHGAVDYVSKCVEVVVHQSNDQQTMIKFLKKHILYRLEIPKAVIKHGDSHSYNRAFQFDKNVPH